MRCREVRDPSVTTAPRSGGFRRSRRMGVGRDLIVTECVLGEPSGSRPGVLGGLGAERFRALSLLSPRRRPSDEAVGLVGPEAILQPLDEAGVDLADARLREPCQVTDLAHGQLFPVLEIDDPTLLI